MHTCHSKQLEKDENLCHSKQLEKNENLTLKLGDSG